MTEYIDFLLKFWYLSGTFLLILIIVITIQIVIYLKKAKSINISETINLINSDEAIILDIRDRIDFKKGHITKSINISKSEIPTSLAKLDKFSDKIIVVVCQNGYNAATVGDKLLQKRNLPTRVLYGGIDEWQRCGLPLEN